MAFQVGKDPGFHAVFVCSVGYPKGIVGIRGGCAGGISGAVPGPQEDVAVGGAVIGAVVSILN